MSKRKYILIGSVVLVLIIAGIIYQQYKSSRTPSYEVVEVTRGDAVKIISSTGSVKPASEINLQFTTSGKIVEVKVKTGDQVKTGDKLISEDTSDLQFQAQNAQAAVDVVQAKLNQILSGSSAEDIALAQTAVDNAQKSLDDAQKSLSDTQTSADNSLHDVYETSQRTFDVALLVLQNSLRSNADTMDSSDLTDLFSVRDSQALADAKNLRSIAESEYKTAKAAIDEAHIGFDEGKIDLAGSALEKALNSGYQALSRTYDALVATVISVNLTQTELDAFESTISTSRSNLNTSLTSVMSAEQNIASQKITNQSSSNTAQAKVTTAQGQLKSAQDQLALKIAKPRQTDIDLYRAQVNQAQATLNQIRNQIAQKTISAPIDGIITSVLPDIGEIASANQTVISMNSLSNFEIKSEIAESDIADIKTGDPVTITFDAFGDAQKWQGSVVSIDPAQTVVQGVVYYNITVSLSSNDPQIKAGMTANLEIETARDKNALLVPARAIQDSGSQKTVQVLDGQTLKTIEIETGIKNNSGDIEVLSGLSEGQKIAITQ